MSVIRRRSEMCGPEPRTAILVEAERLSRVTLVDHRSEAEQPGVVFERYGVGVDVSVQDGGRTLKIFVNDQEVRELRDVELYAVGPARAAEADDDWVGEDLVGDLMDERSRETSLADREGTAVLPEEEISPDAQRSWTPWWEGRS